MKVRPIKKRLRHTIITVLNRPLNGLNIEIIDHTDRSLISLKGTVSWETKHMIGLDISSSIKKIPKLGGIIKITTPDAKFNIAGKLIDGTYVNRKKKKHKNW